MATDLMKLVEATQYRENEFPKFEPGDTVAVHVRVIEGEKERVQVYQADAAGQPIDEVIFLTPDGEVFTQRLANELSLKQHVVLLAGHYKGVDQRVRDSLVTREVSIGDYVLSGGELPALVLVDALVRLLPGVLGDAVSALSDSFQDDLLDAPTYTRPANFRGATVPEVLLSGNHRRIEAWREEQRLKKTQERRPDLLTND